MLSKSRRGVICVTVLVAIAGAGCKKKTAIAPAATTNPTTANTTAPPPPAPRPAVLEFSAEPSTVERGQAALLKWSVGNATEVIIDNGVGAVTANGTRRVIPSESTTYHLNATGPGGEISAATTVNVTVPAPTSVTPRTPSSRSIDERFRTEVQDVYFDYDKSDIR